MITVSLLNIQHLTGKKKKNCGENFQDLVSYQLTNQQYSIFIYIIYTQHAVT